MGRCLEDEAAARGVACMVVHALRGAKAALSGETGQVSKAALMALRDAILEEDPECPELLEALSLIHI